MVQLTDITAHGYLDKWIVVNVFDAVDDKDWLTADPRGDIVTFDFIGANMPWSASDHLLEYTTGLRDYILHDILGDPQHVAALRGSVGGRPPIIGPDGVVNVQRLWDYGRERYNEEMRREALLTYALRRLGQNYDPATIQGILANPGDHPAEMALLEHLAAPTDVYHDYNGLTLPRFGSRFSVQNPGEYEIVERDGPNDFSWADYDVDDSYINFGDNRERDRLDAAIDGYAPTFRRAQADALRLPAARAGIIAAPPYNGTAPTDADGIEIIDRAARALAAQTSFTLAQLETPSEIATQRSAAVDEARAYVEGRRTNLETGFTTWSSSHAPFQDQNSPVQARLKTALFASTLELIRAQHPDATLADLQDPSFQISINNGATTISLSDYWQRETDRIITALAPATPSGPQRIPPASASQITASRGVRAYLAAHSGSAAFLSLSAAAQTGIIAQIERDTANVGTVRLRDQGTTPGGPLDAAQRLDPTTQITLVLPGGRTENMTLGQFWERARDRWVQELGSTPIQTPAQWDAWLAQRRRGAVTPSSTTSSSFSIGTYESWKNYFADGDGDGIPENGFILGAFGVTENIGQWVYDAHADLARTREGSMQLHAIYAGIGMLFAPSLFSWATGISFFSDNTFGRLLSFAIAFVAIYKMANQADLLGGMGFTPAANRGGRVPTSPQVVGQGGGQQFGRVSGTGYDIQLQNTNGQVPRVITVSHDVDGDGDDDTLNFIDGDGDDMFVGQVILANGKAVHTTAEIFTRADLLQALDMGPHTPSRFQTAATVKAGETFEIQVVDSDGDDVPEAYMINIGGTDHGREGIAHRGDLNTQSLGRIE